MWMTDIVTSSSVTSNNKLPALKLLQRAGWSFRSYEMCRRHGVRGPTFRMNVNRNNSSFCREGYNWLKQTNTRSNIWACNWRASEDLLMFPLQQLSMQHHEVSSYYLDTSHCGSSDIDCQCACVRAQSGYFKAPRVKGVMMQPVTVVSR
jgi:hypothetical protein